MSVLKRTDNCWCSLSLSASLFLCVSASFFLPLYLCLSSPSASFIPNSRDTARSQLPTSQEDILYQKLNWLAHWYWIFYLSKTLREKQFLMFKWPRLWHFVVVAQLTNITTLVPFLMVHTEVPKKCHQKESHLKLSLQFPSQPCRGIWPGIFMCIPESEKWGSLGFSPMLSHSRSSINIWWM